MSTISTTIENTVRTFGIDPSRGLVQDAINGVEHRVEAGTPLDEAVREVARALGYSHYADAVIRAFDSGDAPTPAEEDVDPEPAWFEEFRAEAAQTIRAFITQGSQHLVNAGVGMAGGTEEQVTALLVLAGLEDEPEPEPGPSHLVAGTIVVGDEEESVPDERVSPDSLAALTRVVEDLSNTVNLLVGVARQRGLL